MSDSFLPVVNFELGAAEASQVTDTLRHLAALIDPDDPDGLRDANGRRDQRLEKHLLTDAQFVMLRNPRIVRTSEPRLQDTFVLSLQRSRDSCRLKRQKSGMAGEQLFAQLERRRSGVLLVGIQRD